MRKTLKVFLMFVVAAIAIGGFAHIAKAQDAKFPTAPNVFTVLNDDVPYTGTGSPYNTGTICVNSICGPKLNTKSYGIGGVSPVVPSIPQAAIDIGSNGKCVFVADAGGNISPFEGPGDIAAFDYPGTIPSNYTSHYLGNGYAYGIGLSSSVYFLLAGWSANNVLETFKIGSGCTLSQGTSVTVSGGGGGIDGVSIAPNGKWYLATTADGYYEVGTITSGVLGAPTAYYSICASNYSAVPTGTAIDPTSTYGYMDCLWNGSALIDAFNIATAGTEVENGPLVTCTTTGCGAPIYESNTIGLSADGKQMDIVGTGSGSIETAKVSGLTVTDAGCPTGTVNLSGYNSIWATPGTINALGSSAAGAGGAVVAEGGFGYSGSSYSYMEQFMNGAGNCLTAYAQGTDPNSEYVLSGASYLP